MKIIPGKEQDYKDWFEKQSDDYGRACFRYAEKWAELIEAAIDKGEKLEDVAEQLSHDADEEGITGFIYGMAVGLLSQGWVHGEKLRIWHNLKTQIGNEGEKANESGGVLNPALLSFGDKP